MREHPVRRINWRRVSDDIKSELKAVAIVLGIAFALLGLQYGLGMNRHYPLMEDHPPSTDY